MCEIISINVFTIICGSYNDAVKNSNNVGQNGIMTRTRQDMEAAMA
jgi:hypothetical protein